MPKCYTTYIHTWMPRCVLHQGHVYMFHKRFSLLVGIIVQGLWSHYMCCLIHTYLDAECTKIHARGHVMDVQRISLQNNIHMWLHIEWNAMPCHAMDVSFIHRSLTCIMYIVNNIGYGQQKLSNSKAGNPKMNRQTRSGHLKIKL